MKTRTFFLTVVLILAAVSAALSESIFVGNIVSIVPGEGAIVMVDPSLDKVYGKVAAPEPYSVVFVRGDFSGSADGDQYRIFAEYAGLYNYTAVGGAYKTVRAFNPYHFNRIRRPNNPF